MAFSSLLHSFSFTFLLLLNQQTTARPQTEIPSNLNSADQQAVAFLTQFYQAGNPSPKPIETFLTTTALPPLALSIAGISNSEQQLSSQQFVAQFPQTPAGTSASGVLTPENFLVQFYQAGNPSPKPIDAFLITTTPSPAVSTGGDALAQQFLADFYSKGNPSPRPIADFFTSTTAAPPATNGGAPPRAGDADDLRFLQQFYGANTVPPPAAAGAADSAVLSSGGGSSTLSSSDANAVQFLQEFYKQGNPSPKPIEAFFTSTPVPQFSSSSSGADGNAQEFLKQFYQAGNPSPRPIEDFLSTTTTTTTTGSPSSPNVAAASASGSNSSSGDGNAGDAAAAEFLRDFYSKGNPSPKPIETFLTSTTTASSAVKPAFL